MPRLVAEFRKAIVGKKIVDAGYIVQSGVAWPCLVLNDGNTIVCQMDDEGNGPGSLVDNKGSCLCATAPVKVLPGEE